MARVTTSFSSNPLLTKTSSSPPFYTESKLLGLHFRNPNLTKTESFISLSHIPSSFTINARYGGGGPRPSGMGDSRRSRQAVPELDQALDISSIRSANVRLIDEKQNMVGVVSKSGAIQMAEEAELDLVILTPNADPPVVGIMDYSKYRYEQQKRKREQQKKSAATRMDLKELKMGYNIDQHDYDVRLRAAQKFLKDGDKVKVIVNLKGRENDFRNIAIELIKRFQNDVGELATEESKSFRERNMFITLVPNKAVQQKGQELPKKRQSSVVNEISAGV
ncbi:IF3_C domain-containing protein/IF3_N domain-containing protein [Cephalotus follicularis]|uniref:IF3_C domain-containing protein/IF3_N domain-containing protein n=1 Tax=Cephalotus follicularis TaxID=3775 RepID=A0A1Q3CC58_CEPFO|nr:IF3_C domain-containing protein/IF3_N domain-containing protein [Cephalotus follicularis]